MMPPRGLPAALPLGERVLWQGAPGPAALARGAFHARGTALYFAGLTALALAVALARGEVPGAALALAIGGGVAVGLLALFGWIAARTTVYTLTDRRLVLRIGMALPMSVNLPLAQIAAVDLSERGDIALRMTGGAAIGWLMLWPHARPWRLARPEPMLRCLPDAPEAARAIAAACLALSPARSAAAVPPAVRLASTPAACAA